MKFRTRLKASQTLIDLTPLVDVVFLMLIFFIVASDILPLKSLRIENPKLSQDAMPLTTQLLVVMDAQQVIYVGSKKDIVGMSELKEQLDRQVAALKKLHPGAHPSVVLSVDGRVDYGTFLQLFSIAQGTGSPIRLVYQTIHEAEAPPF